MIMDKISFNMQHKSEEERRLNTKDKYTNKMFSATYLKFFDVIEKNIKLNKQIKEMMS